MVSVSLSVVFSTLVLNNSTDFVVGGRRITHNTLFTGGLSFCGVGIGTITESDITKLYNNGIPVCYDDLDLDITLTSFSDLGNFNGNTGAEIDDLTLNSNNLTNVGSPTYTDQGLTVECTPTTIYDVNSATLNGTSQYYDAGNSNPIANLSNWTLNIHVKIFSSNNDYPMLFASWDNDSNITERSFQLYPYISQNKLVFIFSTDGGTSAPVSVEVPYNLPIADWVMITVTKDGSDYIFYENGVQISTTQTNSSSIYDNNKGFQIGTYTDGSSDSNRNIEGNITAPKIFNRALSANEVTTLYNNGTPKCFDEIPTSITDDCIYAPRLANWTGNVGQELIDQSTSGITTTSIGSPTYTDQGLTVECTS